MLPPGVVQIYRTELTHKPADVTALESNLPLDEQQAAARFRFAEGRERFVLGRTMLRGVLAQHLDTSPGEIALQFTGHGKPRLADDENSNADLQFNLSHSGDLVLLAVARSMSIGVDIELHRDIKRRDQIARGVMTDSEWKQFSALPEADRGRAFFHLWTQKEAIVKAVGRGLLHPLTEVEVSLTCGDARLIRFGDQGSELPYHLTSIGCDLGYTAALATCAKPSNIEIDNWPT